MTTQHTPGPWAIKFLEHQGASTSRLYVCNPSDYIAEVYIPNYWKNIDQAISIARLIAAAPDMLAALEALEAVLRMSDRDIEVFDVARAAIAKAKGE